MSSGEKAKPPTTYEERNPFDISRRSEKDIAAEIAQRMAAWKQARGRSYATPSTVPSGEARLPPISAPVLPARPPKSGGHATPAPQPRQAEARQGAPMAAPTAAKPAQSGARAPLFATLSAMRRAMPPAPSLKRPIAHPEAPTATPANAAAEIEAPKTAMPKIETVETAATQSAVPAPVEPVAERADIATVDAAVEASETLRGDAPLEAAMSDRDAHAAGQRDVDRPSSDAPATLATEARDLSSTHASAMPEIEPAAPEAEAPEVEAPVAESRRIELSAPVIPSIDALEAATRRIEGRERREPTFAAPAPPSIEAHDIEADPVQEDEIDAPVAESGRIELVAPAMPSIEELEAVTHRIEGRERKEPTFDEPAAERPAAEDAAPVPLAAEQPDKAARTGTRVALPGIETRIETRRIESLRADPQMAGWRPIFPHIDPEEWPSEQPGESDIPPVVAAHAQHQPRGGTGWAISLGAILLIAGITAPAAIWQGRQQVPADQDQLVMLPVPASPSKPETKPAAQATLPAAPQPETSPPEITQPEITQPPVTAAEAPSAPPPPEVPQPAPEEQTTLSAVQSGGELNEAPISTPPAPVLDLASKPKVQFPQAQSDVAAGDVPFPPAARPFVPEPGTPQGAKPFLPTQAGASVPVNSTALPAGTQAGAQTASIALKPNLMGQLKPKAPAARTASTTPKPVSRKPKPFFQQPPDQMFQTLIDTLSAGQPVNPATKPTPPSTRK